MSEGAKSVAMSSDSVAKERQRMRTYLFKDKELVDYMMSFQSGVSPVEVRNELLNKVDELINEYDGEIPAYRNDIDSILSLSDIFDDMFRSMIERADEAGIDV